MSKKVTRARHGHASGGKRSITYSSWAAMVQRTTNPSHRSFPDYAGKVDPTFLGEGGFARFLAHVGERPSKRHTLDRKDPRRGYEPGNLRWATKLVQERNKLRDTFYGLTTTEWGKALRVEACTIRKRRERGWSDDRMFPVHLRRTETR